MRTNVAIVVDESQSIQAKGLTNHINKMVNDVIGTLATIERDTGQEYIIDLWTFGNQPRLRHCGFTAKSFPHFDDYFPNENTALYDAVCDAATLLPINSEANLVIVITDGEENWSSRVTRWMFKTEISAWQATGKYSFVFHVPPGHKAPFVAASGVPADNVQEWEQTDRGVVAATVSHTDALQRYSTVRAIGGTQTTDYFATSDASEITDRDLAGCRCNKSRFKLYTVQKEDVAKGFAEGKTKSRYVIGQLYYQLMKPETVQASKQLVLREKTTGQYFAGPQLRGLLGLPSNLCKVDPGNHANYDVFVQSTSVNRKLPRGTKVLIDTHQLSDKPPTWDHTAVKRSNLTERQKRLIGSK